MRSGSTGSPAASLLRSFRNGFSGSSQNRQHGFTLVESLTALSVLAIALVALLQSYSQSMLAARASDHHAIASLLAQNLLAEARGRIDFTKTARQGQTKQFSWRVNIQPTGATLRMADDETAALYRISVDVNWARSQNLKLETLTLSRVQ